MAIYTKKGDKGETGLFSESGEQIRVSKSSLRIEAIGATDELNSFIGICANYCETSKKLKLLRDIQINLFTINSIIAGANLSFSKSETTRLEREIDKIESKTAKLTSFVLPAGTKYATHLMYARTLARKAERRVSALARVESIHSNITMYMNRLSDMMFMLFREANFDAGEKETFWKGRPEKASVGSSKPQKRQSRSGQTR